MATPNIPPRPQRSPARPAVAGDIPSIPPRPARHLSVSPEPRESSTRSPLNVPPTGKLFAAPPADLPRRPPSVVMPSVGQEGSEYSSYDQLPQDAVLGAPETNVSADVPLHQPKASLPAGAAKQQIQTVTRTDSAQAAAAGVGEARRRSINSDALPLRSKASFSRSTSSFAPLERTTSRPGSVHSDHEHGIPEIGMQIPLYKSAGDVQAPSPAPAYSQHAPGIGFHNDGSARAHVRKRSSRQEFGPPDSYGLRHDHDRQDQFERDWAAKHPDEVAREEYHLHVPKPATALSSEQLNRLVGQSADIGFGTSRDAVSTPDQSVAFDATDEYVSRISSAKASPAPEHTHPESSPAQEEYHLKPSSRGANKWTGGGEADHKAELAGYSDSVGHVEDGAPILAYDEVIKRPGSAYMQAAVNPDAYISGDEAYDSDGPWPQSRRSSAQLQGRSSSRPPSTQGYHGGSLHRYISHEELNHSAAALAEIEEYEPLFPDDDNSKAGEQKKTPRKRLDLASHHFPSQDTWEDTPASLQYSAEVSTPDLELDQATARAAAQPPADAAAVFETPQQEQHRRRHNSADMTSDRKTLIKPHFKPGVVDEMHDSRPGLQRFPSSDIWEDTPESMHLQTTVSGPQMDDTRALPEERPTTSAIPSQQDDDAARASTGLVTRPTIPTRPDRRSGLANEVPQDAEPSDPTTKPKPSIPARPVRSAAPRAAEPDAVPRTKPAVPARPGGEKIAALRAGFMSDLNNRLKLGPQAPSSKSDDDDQQPPAAEKAPLPDARKSRARGPVRRKPGPPPAASASEFKSGFSFAMSPLITVWTIDEEDELLVAPPAAKTHGTPTEVAEDEDDEDETAAHPPAHVGAEGDRPVQGVSDVAVDRQKAVQPELEQALAQA